MRGQEIADYMKQKNEARRREESHGYEMMLEKEISDIEAMEEISCFPKYKMYED